jgi:formylmethanofuran dehydrogenase subunit E
MSSDHHGFSKDEMNTRMDANNIGGKMKEYIQKCVAFHSSPAPGVLIGAFMVDYAMDLLSVTPDMKLYAVCETPKCAPDALQVIAHCTTGNNRLRVVPIGKFAITLNAATHEATPDNTATAIRVYVDLNKLKKFPVIDKWYANSPTFDKPTMKDTLQSEIFRAGREILSFERVRVAIIHKLKWESVTCPDCGETVPDYLAMAGRCGGCGSMKYYEKITDQK